MSLPDEVQIAAALGIEELHVGRHYLRDEQRFRVGRIWLDTLWLLRVEPSFDSHGLIGVITSHGEEFRGSQSTGWMKAVLSSNDAFVVQDIEADPLPDLVAGLPLLRKSHSMFLDGIGYQLRVETMALEGFLKFFNPKESELVAVELSCWQLADTVARESRNETLIAFTKAWRRYLAFHAN